MRALPAGNSNYRMWKGLGASRKKEQEYWLQQQESFQSLLQNLNGGDEENVEIKSLEERSKTSKARVHYHKFTRGKDISRYSKKDLSCIVGSCVPAPKITPSSVVSNSQQAAYELQTSVANGCLQNSSSESASIDSKQHLTSNMELRERKNNNINPKHAEENPVPAKKKKSKKSSDANEGILKDESSNSDYKNDLSPNKRQKSDLKLVTDPQTSTNKTRKRPKKNPVGICKEEESPPVGEIAIEDADEEVVSRPKKSPKRKPSKTDGSHDTDDDKHVAVKLDKRKLRERKSNTIEAEPSKENPVPAKQKKSKKSPDANGGILKDESSNSAVHNDVSPNKRQKITPVGVTHEDVHSQTKKLRDMKKSKKDDSHDTDDGENVAVKQDKIKNKATNKLKDSAKEEISIEVEPKKRNRKKKKELVNVEIESAVENQPSKKKLKRKKAVILRDEGQEETEEIHTSSKNKANTGKGRKKKDKSSVEQVVPEDLPVTESQETVVSSNTQPSNDDAETELDSINSQSSLITEVLGVKQHDSLDISSRPEVWFKNHILSPESENETSSDEEVK